MVDKSKNRIFLDPGIGFGKSVEQNIQLIRASSEFHKLGHPLLYGISRKSFLGVLTSRDVKDRLHATLGAATYLMFHGVSVLRVHDVAAHNDVRKVLKALLTGMEVTP